MICPACKNAASRLHLIHHFVVLLPLKGKAKRSAMNEKYNAKLQPNARALRKRMTPEERHLWYDFLKGLSVTVKRQQVIGSYIVDFYCASAKLVIELDGEPHYEGNGLKRDAVRDYYLKSSGYIVKRYSNSDIHRNFEGVCRDIYIAIFKQDRD